MPANRELFGKVANGLFGKTWERKKSKGDWAMTFTIRGRMRELATLLKKAFTEERRLDAELERADNSPLINKILWKLTAVETKINELKAQLKALKQVAEAVEAAFMAEREAEGLSGLELVGHSKCWNRLYHTLLDEPSGAEATPLERSERGTEGKP